MKRLAVFCDGTWNDLRMAQHTNVARLAKCVADVAPRGVRQVVYYDSGVGVASGVSRFVDWLVGVAGGAFGRGLDEKIEAAYRFIVLNYEVGDEIYVFGFSRGAYTARSLCGLIRKCGIVRRDCFDVIPRAMQLYRSEAPPWDVASFRGQYGHKTSEGHTVAAGREDLADSRKGRWDHRHGPSEAREGGEDIYKLMFLGLWDTVGSLGVPVRFKTLARLFNARYRFHDTDASSLITHLRHACAVNEDRQVFDLTPVSNIDGLNRDWADATGRDVDHPAAANFTPYAERPYQQRWFPGDHGAVGGGNPEPGLSSGALLWVAEGGARAGLELRRTPANELGEAARLANPLAEWRIRKDGARRGRWEFEALGLVGGYHDRTGPLVADEVHETSWDRIARSPDYRPPPLQRFTGALWPVPRYRVLAGWLFWPLMALVLVGLLLAAVLLGFALFGLWLGLKMLAALAGLALGALRSCV